MFDRNNVVLFRMFLEVRPFLRSNIFTNTVFTSANNVKYVVCSNASFSDVIVLTLLH